eukprot:COSAG05_NODE_2999_length_2423_cov_23.041308_2_plen_232_part_00
MPIAAVSWGGGDFTVQQAGSLSLANVAVGGEITVQGGGRLSVSGGSLDGTVTVAQNGTVHLQNVVWEGFAVASASNDGPYALPWQCFQPHTTLRDSWRSTGTGQGTHCDQSSGTGVGGGRWYRFAGAGGDALPLTPPGGDHCGTGYPGWLSGWATPQGGGAPPTSYSGAGRYPAMAEGVVESTVCFDQGDSGYSCENHVQVGVVRCGGFLLWRLPDVPGCNYGYCTAASGL